ncbi:hypothetical protein BKA69DRAFT_294113 [Paraphysoderma sedebokerense]|nr:hypothetical protein BKA69DRAFT_294113 [Paraphysoderma sedebokerense]
MSTELPTPPSDISYAVVTIVLNVYLITTTGCILFFRSTPIIRTREPLLTFISASCGIVVFNFLWDFQQIFSDGSLCLPLLLLLHLILPLVLFCYTMRIFYVILAYHLHHLGINNAVRNKGDTKIVLADTNIVQRSLLRIGKCLINTQTDRLAVSEIPILLAGVKMRQLLKSILCLVAFEAVVFMITILSSKSDRVRQLQASIHQCEAHSEVFSVVGLYFAFAVVVITGMLFRLWKIKDQVYTKFEMSIVVLIIVGIFAVSITSMVNNSTTEIRLLKYALVSIGH